MKRSILMIAMLVASVSASAQFYVSASGGYSFPAADVKFGTETTTSGVENTYGSYGEGLHTQLRAGYFFNEKWGVELAGGYLHGSDQTSLLLDVPNQPYVNVKARGRAYGLSASVIYNIDKNFYGRAGFLTKVGGRTEVVGKVNATLPANLFNPAAPAGLTTDLTMDLTRDFRGKFPLGFIGAIGYKHKINESLSLFAEVEYMGISVTRDKSTIGDFKATLGGNNVTREQLLQMAANTPALQNGTFGSILPLINDEITYVDNLTPAEYAETQSNPLARKQLTQNVPYSSVGFNIGITYTFGK